MRSLSRLRSLQAFEAAARHGSFTGAFLGMIAFDTSGRGQPADFSHFSYESRDG